MKRYTVSLLVSIFILLSVISLASCLSRMQRKTEQERMPRSITEAFYAGQLELAIELFSGPNARAEQRQQLVVLYWELGENARAAELLEELIKDPYITAAERDEMRLDLFITRVLMGSYAQAAMMRDDMKPVVEGLNSRLLAQYYFFRAWIYHETGDLKSAEEFYRKSLDLYRWRSIAWYRLGTILLDTNPGEAERAFQTCWNMDRAFTPVLLPLARLLSERGEWDQARNLLVTANTRLPGDPEINTALAEAQRNAPEAEDDTLLIRRRIAAVPPRVRPAPVIHGEGIMRIGLAVNRSLVSVKAGGEFTIRNASTRQVLYNGAERQQFWVEWIDGDSLTIHDGNNNVLLDSSVPVVFQLHNNHNTSIVAGVVSGAPGVNRTYRGDLEFRPTSTGITVVNIVNMGDYLYGVVPAEMPATWPMEALKAQAIASRSYAMAYRGAFASRGFDIWSTAHSQVYNGVGVEHVNSTAAVDATRGIILIGESNQPLAAYYSANHGGHSEDSLVMWGRCAYMQAVSDRLLPQRISPLPPWALFRWLMDTPETYSNIPGFHFSNTYRWERWISPGEIRRRLILDNRIAQDPGEIRQIVTRRRGISGRIAELEVKGSLANVTVARDAVWFTMGGLRSSLFSIRYKLSPCGAVQYFIFQGAGYGHGMGMDQHAAAGKASRGMSAEEILLHFYPRASLRQLQ